MPIGQREYHPYLKIGEAIPATRMIIGTYPIYSITRPWLPIKATFKQQWNDMLFFYGSSANQMWNHYKRYVDPTILLGDNRSILSSLKRKKIAISDVVQSCERNNFSPSDDDLIRKVWNRRLSALIYKNIDKIICTSKGPISSMGWLINHILIPAGFKIDAVASNNLHQMIIGTIRGGNPLVNNVACVLTKDEKIVSIVSIPSPAGNGKRSLKHFGYVKGVHTTGGYLNSYLKIVFAWF